MPFSEGYSVRNSMSEQINSIRKIVTMHLSVLVLFCFLLGLFLLISQQKLSFEVLYYCEQQTNKNLKKYFCGANVHSHHNFLRLQEKYFGGFFLSESTTDKFLRDSLCSFHVIVFSYNTRYLGRNTLVTAYSLPKYSAMRYISLENQTSLVPLLAEQLA